MSTLSKGTSFNWHAVRAIYRFEMARTFRTLLQSVVLMMRRCVRCSPEWKWPRTSGCS